MEKEESIENAGTGKSSNALTAREHEVITLFKEGLKYTEIGDTLFISAETVRRHATNIYSKLKVKNRTQAINKYFR